VRLLLALLSIPYELVQVDIMKGESRTPEFLANVNANGRIPVLEIAPDKRLAESNAILLHLAEGTKYLPSDAWQRAQVYELLFFEQYSHEPNVATARFWILAGRTKGKEALLEEKIARGYDALALMDRHLATRTFLVGEAFTIADIALYAYTHV